MVTTSESSICKFWKAKASRVESKKRKVRNEQFKKETQLYQMETKCEICCFYLKFDVKILKMLVFRDKCWRNDVKISIQKCHFLVHYSWRELLDWSRTSKAQLLRVQEGKIMNWLRCNQRSLAATSGKISIWFWSFWWAIFLSLEFCFLFLKFV